jgi:RNA polymerase sigma-70 factor (ECF subfamily)
MDTGFAAAVAVLGNPHDAEDAVQNAFIRALERIDQLKPGSPFGPWFFRVLRSTALNLRRREVLRTHEEIPASASAGSNPEKEWERGLTRQAVLSALDELPEMQRLTVTLYDLEGYSHREISDILEIAVGTSRAHVHHGRKSLRQRLGDEFVPRDEDEWKDDGGR